jgi:hypothetical protein
MLDTVAMLNEVLEEVTGRRYPEVGAYFFGVILHVHVGEEERTFTGTTRRIAAAKGYGWIIGLSKCDGSSTTDD